MTKYIFFLLSVLSIVSCKTQNDIYVYSEPLSVEAKNAQINYTISTPRPETHFADVVYEINNYSKEYIDVKMPVWAPGSYLIREFPRFVENFKAQGDNKDLKTDKIAKNIWRVYTNNAKDIKVSYSVYCFELSVRTSFVDDSHAYFNGTSVFMYVDDLMQKSGTLTVVPHENFKKVTTSLQKKEDFTYTFTNYDYLVDCPIEIGNQETFDFSVNGIPHHVAIYGDANYDVEQLKMDMKKVCESSTAVFGENPNKDYTFIIHNLTVGSGGLEHHNSTTLQVGRETYDENYKGFLSLVAHEYFHLWNVKRIRPEALGPFDYEKENYTHLLWVMEGFTSYYESIILRDAGFYTDEEMIKTLNGKFSYVENSPGNRVQSATEASFDAWIKAYRPHENIANTTISYYSKGATLAQLIDFEIINSTNGKRNLDNLMQYLYKEYAVKKKRGFTDEEFQKAVENIAEKSMDSFFEQYVFEPGKPNYSDYFAPIGLNFTETAFATESPELDASLRGNVIARMTQGGTAYESGLNVNDYIVKIGDEIVKNNVSEILAKYKVGETVTVELLRDGVKRSIPVKLDARKRTLISIEKMEKLTKQQQTNFDAWTRQ